MSGSSERGRQLPSTTRPIPGDIPATGRLLGLDYGTRRIGIAVSDDEQRFASALENYTRARTARTVDAQHLKEIAEEYRAVGLVVGLPLHMGGEEGQKAAEARRFGIWAAQATELPVVFWDERLTSASAEEHLLAAQLTRKKRKLRLDMVAAQIMLQSYLDSRSNVRP